MTDTATLRRRSPVAVYFRNIARAMGTAVQALLVTGGHLFTRSVTMQYPREVPELPARARHRLHVMIEDCIGCRLCERACPVECITMETIKSPASVDLGKTSSGNKKNYWMTDYRIDMAKCCYCGLCVDPCPTGCITMTPGFEYSTSDIVDHVFTFSRMSPAEVKEVTGQAEEEARRKAEEKKRKAEERARKVAEAKAAEAKAAGDPPAGKSADPEGGGE